MVDSHYVWAATDVGCTRSENEDRFRVGPHRGEGLTAAWRGVLSRAMPWVLVADGMGGHDAGEVASEVALSAIEAGLANVQAVEDIVDLIDTANLRVFESMYGHEGRPGMGSTVVGALMMIKDRALIFNVGDSRAYRFFDGRLTQLSEDHSLGVSASGKRSPMLTQSLGGSLSRRPLNPVALFADFPEGSELLLCSDGLTDLLPDDEIAAIIVRNRQDPANALIRAARDAGGYDNITVAVVRPQRADVEIK